MTRRTVDRSFYLFHAPTMMLSVGYVVFWIELYVIRMPEGHTSPLAAVLLAAWLGWMIVRDRETYAGCWARWQALWSSWSPRTRAYVGCGAVLGSVTLLCGLSAALLPPHLIQEFDVLNYHITLPRQHLILGSFRHIPWSTADLYLLPLDFALAPYWLMTALPNKFPQFLFLTGVLGLGTSLAGKWGATAQAKILLIFGLLGSHYMGIQIGIGMLDIVMCYLALAALHSFLERQWGLAAVELTLYFWSKSFIPIQVICVVLLTVVLYWFVRKCGFGQVGWTSENPLPPAELTAYRKGMRNVLGIFVLASLVVGGPFVGKSLYYAGTPLFPFLTGRFMVNPHIDPQSPSWQSLLTRVDQVLSTKDQYGSGRSLKDFIVHFWLIAVPEKGVNNRYDYPVGLMYLLCLGPFVYCFLEAWRRKIFPIVPVLIIAFWVVWWLGSQQMRFLVIPLTLMTAMVMARSVFHTGIFKAGVLLCVALVMISVVRAHKRDFGKSAGDVLRPQDHWLIEQGERSRSPLTIDFFDAAYAGVPVVVIGKDSVFVIDYEGKLP